MDRKKATTMQLRDWTCPQLFIGPPQVTAHHALQLICTYACPAGGCMVCSTCLSIKNHNYYALTWIQPQERYTLDDLKPIVHIIAFTLDDDTHHSIVIEHVDLLTAACANSLLKTLEEHPRGYHFMLLAQSSDRVLATIRSRCITTLLHDAHPQEHPLLASIIGTTSITPIAFAKLLETTKFNEQETSELLDQMLRLLLQQQKAGVVGTDNRKKKIQEQLQLVKKLCSRSVMPGSSKLIWRELFLQYAR